MRELQVVQSRRKMRAPAPFEKAYRFCQISRSINKSSETINTLSCFSLQLQFTPFNLSLEELLQVIAAEGSGQDAAAVTVPNPTITRESDHSEEDQQLEENR